MLALPAPDIALANKQANDHGIGALVLSSDNIFHSCGAFSVRGNLRNPFFVW